MDVKDGRDGRWWMLGGLAAMILSWSAFTAPLFLLYLHHRILAVQVISESRVRACRGPPSFLLPILSRVTRRTLSLTPFEKDTADYRSMIRQHFDLETVRMKVEEGLYSEGSVEFFRDLMLLFNNAIVFFPKNSSEHAAATALRAIVSKEMAKTIPKPHRPPAPPLAKEPTTPPRALMKPKSEPAISLNGKPGSTGPIIACRKRSSISAKANPAVAAEMKKKEASADGERKPEAAAAAAGKEADDASVSVAAEPRVTKKRTMERTGGGARGTRTSKTRSNNASNVGGGGGRGSSGNPNSNASPSSGVGGGAAAKAESSEAKAEKKNATNSGVAKKRSAANFLSRVKRSLSSNGTLLDSLKGSSVGGNGRGSATEQKKGGGGGKSEGRRDQGQRQGSNGKQQASAGEQSSGKRSVGRPPKRAAATPPSKRGKETADAEAKAPARKRARR